jgi:hypothetical protein
LKLGSIELTPEITGYVAFLKKVESGLNEQVCKFCKNKELEFPTIKKNSTVKKTKYFIKTEKSLNKLIERIKSRSIDEAEDIHKIRIEFKKFRYKVEVLSNIIDIEESKLDRLKMYQDKLGEIQDYEVLINGIKKYCKKRKLTEVEMIDQFEHDQDSLIVNLDNQIELFITACKDVLNLNLEAESLHDTLTNPDKSGLIEDKTEATHDAEKSTDDQVRKIIDSLVTKSGKVSEKEDAKVDVHIKDVENDETAGPVNEQAKEKSIAHSLKATKPKNKKKSQIENPVPEVPE